LGPVFVSFRDFKSDFKEKRNDFHEFSRRGGFVTSAKTRPLVEDRRVAGGAGSGRLGRPWSVQPTAPRPWPPLGSVPFVFRYLLYSSKNLAPKNLTLIVGERY
jgi:hypothetical protein